MYSVQKSFENFQVLPGWRDGYHHETWDFQSVLLSSGRAQPCLHSKLRGEIRGRLVALLCPLSMNVLLSLKESTRDFYENELLEREGGEVPGSSHLPI